MNRDQHLAAAGLDTISVMAGQARLESLAKEFEALLLLGRSNEGITAHREQMHEHLDIVLDAIARQKHHMRSAMQAPY